MMKTLFLGATRGMGRALSRQMVERGDALHLLGRDIEEVAKTAADLSATRDRLVTFSRFDLDEPQKSGEAIEEGINKLGGLHRIVLTAGIFGTQESLETSPELAARVLQTNFVNTILFCESARVRILARGGGQLVVFSSVAGDRARKPVVIYGATKAGLSAYLEGLDARFKREGLDVTIVKPGFVRTGMTRGLKEPPFAADPEEAAAAILRGIDRRATVVYAPPIWRWVMAVVKRLPRAVLRRAAF